MDVATLGVGILGCGPVTQAIHLPTLARFRDTFHVARVMDVDAEVARAVADRAGSAWTTSADEVIADEDVQVVVVCSPNQFHAEQVIAACRAGKRAVLCEKPLAVTREEARRIAEASAETGVPVVVGAMHTFDPGWIAAVENWGDLVDRIHTIRYSIVLTPNTRSEDFATEIHSRPTRTAPELSAAERAAGEMFGNIMGLAIHDLPLVRRLCPDFRDVELLSAQTLSPGYLLDLRIGDRSVQVYGHHTTSWRPEWRVEAIADDVSLVVDFPPPYVHAGSGTATFRARGESRIFGPYDTNGYEEEWRYLSKLVTGAADPLDTQVLVDDVVFAIGIAESATAVVRAAAEKAEVTA
ncbi:Gfo/Idh/MocA family protein [Naasia sp. SYSU D00948]|uniref:Gfo/Idh/MocA family protein n=1 Tax=Naasia sp. SYSU D00948 TaxID=2817379 RepID=UPI001B306507|nr:Gfo/Idh/MocA family oxidoreductase [Naasia sp. SYSU D00948]